MKTIKLYGGALTTKLPQSFISAADLRQIPDNQEVFVDSRPSNACWICEILELHPEARDQTDFHFNELKEANEAVKAQLISTDLRNSEAFLPGTLTNIWINIGLQAVSKFNVRDKVDFILVLMAVIRLEQFDCDIVVSMSIPVDLNVATLEVDHKWNSLVRSLADKQYTSAAQISESMAMFQESIDCLVLHDTSLFT